jgi:hypothetical protein
MTCSNMRELIQETRIAYMNRADSSTRGGKPLSSGDVIFLYDI